MLGKQKIKKQHEDAAQKGKVIWKLHGVTFLKKVWGPWKVSPVPPALSGPALRKLLTLTSDTSIFKVCTVMNSKWVARAVYKSGFPTTAIYIVQKDGTSSLTKLCKWNSSCSCGPKFANSWTKLLQSEEWFNSYSMLTINVWHYIGDIYKPVPANPSCLHATLASGAPQKSSHTVPHWLLLLQISTRPSLGFAPPWSLMLPFVHVPTSGREFNHQ